MKEEEEIEKILFENKKLKEENEILKRKNKALNNEKNQFKKELDILRYEIEDLKFQMKEMRYKQQENLKANMSPKEEISFKSMGEIDPSERNDEFQYYGNDLKKNGNNEKTDDMHIISFLARSDKRVQILKSLSKSDKIPSVIGKEIDDSSHHVSKYLASLKEKGLVLCLNEDDKRFRFYTITDKGRKYLDIIEKNEF